MIGKLRGKIDEVLDGNVIIDVNGVGYEVFCSNNTLSKLQPGEFYELSILTHVREDHIHLYGFLDKEEKRWFNILTTVKGVGSKMALAVLSFLTPNNLQTAILTGDKNVFKEVSGVGPKLALRIITELKDNNAVSSLGLSSDTINVSSINQTQNSASADAISALSSLGYKRIDIMNAVSAVLKQDPTLTTEEIVRISLSKL